MEDSFMYVTAAAAAVIYMKTPEMTRTASTRCMVMTVVVEQNKRTRNINLC